MIRVLFMPFLQMPSGHHHVADSIKYQLMKSSKDKHEKFYYEKLEILSYCYGKFEPFVSSIYLQSIHKIPSIYSQIYKFVVVKGTKNKNYQLYDLLFLKKMLRVLDDKNPHVIFCTHALPSYLLSRIKKNNQWAGIVINVYTDYFVNELWGTNHIDYHFAPSIHVKQELVEKGVSEKCIMITGIPVHPVFKQQTEKSENKDELTVLISGGNMGAGSIHKLLKCLNPSGVITYQVLCGKNHKLFQTVKKINHPKIKALPYLETKEEMNQLYDAADAIITKPGGVTISECIWKKIPIFIYEALPGQEEFNLHYLKNQGLVSHLHGWDSSNNLEEELINNLKDANNTLDLFHDTIEKKDISIIIEELLK